MADPKNGMENVPLYKTNTASPHKCVHVLQTEGMVLNAVCMYCGKPLDFHYDCTKEGLL